MSLTPKNWKVFQHYKDRKPPWIKLHREMLDDFEFHSLPVASRALAPFLWLLASEFFNGEISASDEEVCFRLRMKLEDYQSALKPLIDNGFFISDIVSLADCKHGARLEEERETEEEKRRGERPSGNFQREKEVKNGSPLIEASDRAVAILTEAERKMQPKIRGGESQDVVRMLPQRGSQ